MAETRRATRSMTIAVPSQAEVDQPTSSSAKLPNTSNSAPQLKSILKPPSPNLDSPKEPRPDGPKLRFKLPPKSETKTGTPDKKLTLKFPNWGTLVKPLRTAELVNDLQTTQNWRQDKGFLNGYSDDQLITALETLKARAKELKGRNGSLLRELMRRYFMVDDDERGEERNQQQGVPEDQKKTRENATEAYSQKREIRKAPVKMELGEPSSSAGVALSEAPSRSIKKEPQGDTDTPFNNAWKVGKMAEIKTQDIDRKRKRGVEEENESLRPQGKRRYEAVNGMAEEAVESLETAGRLDASAGQGIRNQRIRSELLDMTRKFWELKKINRELDRRTLAEEGMRRKEDTKNSAVA